MIGEVGGFCDAGLHNPEGDMYHLCALRAGHPGPHECHVCARRWDGGPDE